MVHLSVLYSASTNTRTGRGLEGQGLRGLRRRDFRALGGEDADNAAKLAEGEEASDLGEDEGDNGVSSLKLELELKPDPFWRSWKIRIHSMGFGQIQSILRN
ncbi:hypothetical protein AAC387_Pa05g3285 [Persea americana]